MSQNEVYRLLDSCEALTEQETRSIKNHDLDSVNDALARRKPLLAKLSQTITESAGDIPEDAQSRVRELSRMMEVNKNNFDEWTSSVKEVVGNIQSAEHRLRRMGKAFIDKEAVATKRNRLSSSA